MESSRHQACCTPGFASAAVLSSRLHRVCRQAWAPWRTAANSMPGWRTSIPKRALPLVLDGMSHTRRALANQLPVRAVFHRHDLSGWCPAAPLAIRRSGLICPRRGDTTPCLHRQFGHGHFPLRGRRPNRLARAVAAAARAAAPRHPQRWTSPRNAFMPSSRAILPTIHSPTRTLNGLLPILRTPADGTAVAAQNHGHVAKDGVMGPACSSGVAPRGTSNSSATSMDQAGVHALPHFAAWAWPE
jgi:hypothetical protein